LYSGGVSLLRSFSKFTKSSQKVVGDDNAHKSASLPRRLQLFRQPKIVSQSGSKPVENKADSDLLTPMVDPSKCDVLVNGFLPSLPEHLPLVLPQLLNALIPLIELVALLIQLQKLQIDLVLILLYPWI
jgi:hypothetical protein